MPQPNRPSEIRWWRWAVLAVLMLIGIGAALVLAPRVQPIIQPSTGGLAR